MRVKQSALGVVGVLACVLVAAFAAGPAQAKVTTPLNHAMDGPVLTLPPAPPNAYSMSSAVSPTISPSVRTVHVPEGGTVTCDYGNLCASVWDPTTSDWKLFFLYTCNKYALSDWDGVGDYANYQTGGVTSYFYDSNSNVLKSFTTTGIQYQQDWTPVWYIRNC